MVLLGLQGPLTPDGHSSTPGDHKAGSAQRIGLKKIPMRKSETASQDIGSSDLRSYPQDPPGTYSIIQYLLISFFMAQK